MKKQILVLAAISACLFMSCASKEVADDEIYYEGDEGFSNVIDTPEIREDFIGDYNPIQLDDKMVLVKNFKKLSPKELRNSYLIPRKNTVEITFRYGANSTVIILNQKERTAIKEAAEKFLEEYEAKELHKHKVSRKTAYYRSYCPLYYGLLSTNNGTKKNEYYANYDIIDKRAYFLLHFVPSRNETNNTPKGSENGSVSSFTPKTVLYMSPTQVREFLELMDQEYLLSRVQNLNDKAYTY